MNDIHLLLNLLDNLLDNILRSPAGNRIFMNTPDRRSRYIQAFDIQLPACKNSRNLIQYTSNILRMSYFP